jgi:hypothetical protein
MARSRCARDIRNVRDAMSDGHLCEKLRQAKAPPPKTRAFWDIVDGVLEYAELADVLDAKKNPDATTLNRILRNRGMASCSQDPASIPQEDDSSINVRCLADHIHGLWRSAVVCGQPRNEHWRLARSATASFTLDGKSSRLLLRKPELDFTAVSFRFHPA